MLPQLRVGIDPVEVERILVRFLRDYIATSGRRGFVLGLSGGLDSAVSAALAVRALGPDKVHAMVLPDDTTDPVHLEDAASVARSLGISPRTLSIQPLLDAFARTVPEADRTAHGNAKARIRMLLLHAEAARRHGLVLGTGNKSELLTGYFCYDEKTRALTPQGPKSYDELHPGDIVFSMDLKTREVVETPISGVQAFDYDGDLIEIKTDRMELQVTPNHRILLSRNHGDGTLGFEAAEKRMAGGATAVPFPEPWAGIDDSPAMIDTAHFLKSPLARNANPPAKMPVEDFLYLMGIFIGDETLSTGKVRTTWKGLSTAERSNVRDETGRFTIVDSEISSKTYDAPRVFLASVRGKRSRQPILELLARAEIRATQPPTLLAVANRGLHASFVDCGHLARNKRIPRWAMRLPARLLLHLYRGLMDSDGDARGGSYTTTSSTLAYQMVELAAKLGKHARITWRGPRVSRHKGKEIRSSGYFSVSLTHRLRTLSFRPANMRRLPYKGKVWCVTADPHANLLVERNGNTTFCGNSKYGDGGVDVQPLGDLYKTQVRELALHLAVPQQVIDKPPTAGLWAGQTDEAELGLPYAALDRVLLGLEIRLPPAAIADAVGVPVDQVARIERMRSSTQHKRRMPLIPKIGLRSVGLDWRAATLEG